MFQTIFRILVIVMICGWFVPTACGISYNIEDFLLSNSSVDSMNLYADGDFVVFSDMMLMGLYGYQLSQRDLFEIPTNTSILMGVKKKGTHMIWTTDSGLQGYDLEARESISIWWEPMIDSMNLALSDQYAFWIDPNGFELRGFDFDARDDFVAAANQSVGMSSMKAAGDYLIWHDMNSNTLRAYDVQASEILDLFTGDIDFMSLDMNEAYVVWSDMSGIFHGYDLAGRQSFQIASGDVDLMSIRLSGQFAVWRAMMEMDLLGYDLAARESFTITESDIDTWTLAVSSRYAVWAETAMTGMRINGYDLAARRFLPLYILCDYSYPLAIAGDYLIWLAYDVNTSIYTIEGFDLVDRLAFPVATLDMGAPTFSPLTTDGYVIWQDYDEAEMVPLLMGGQIFKVLNDTCADAVELIEGVPYPGDTTGATGSDLTGCGYQDELDVWHTYVPTAGGEVTITTDGSSFDTTLAVFNACGGLEMACNDDYSLNNTQSKVEVTVVKGKTYLVRVAGFNNLTGEYQVLVSRGACAAPPLSDLDGDCKVTMADLAILAGEWCQCGLEPPTACLE